MTKYQILIDGWQYRDPLRGKVVKAEKSELEKVVLIIKLQGLIKKGEVIEVVKEGLVRAKILEHHKKLDKKMYARFEIRPRGKRRDLK